MEDRQERACPRSCGCEPYWHSDSKRAGGGHWRCRVRHNESQRRYRTTPEGRASQHKAKRRIKLRNRRAVADELARRGGGCLVCGSPDVEWHHRDPADKEFEISKGVQRQHALARLLAELTKCDPLCEEHHLAEHGHRLSLAYIRQLAGKLDVPPVELELGPEWDACPCCLRPR